MAKIWLLVGINTLFIGIFSAIYTINGTIIGIVDNVSNNIESTGFYDILIAVVSRQVNIQV